MHPASGTSPTVTTPRWMRAASWCGAAVFAGSLAYCAFAYLVRFGRPVPVPADRVPLSLTVDLLLFTGFALHHSIFARTGARAWVARHVPPGLERTVYVVFASLLLVAVCALWQPLPGTAWQVDGAGRAVLHGLQLAGAVLTLRSAARIDVWELAGVRQAHTPPEPPRSAAPQPEPALEIGGPYRWVRHPIYLGWLLLVWPIPTMTGGRLAFAAISTAYLVVAIPFEERTLVEVFGEAYRRYQRQVRWRLLPGVW